MSCGTALAFLSSKGFSEALCALPFRSRPPCPPSPPQRLQLMCGDENLCRCLCRRTSRVIQSALVAHTLVCVGSTAIRLPIKTLPGSNYRTDIAITSVSSRLPRFGRIQTKSGPTTPPHVGSFRGHQGSPDLNSCQGGAGWILPPLAANPSLTSSQRDPSTTLSSDRAGAA